MRHLSANFQMSPGIKKCVMTFIASDQYAPSEQVTVDGVTYEVTDPLPKALLDPSCERRHGGQPEPAR
jgi:hypothetical protein